VNPSVNDYEVDGRDTIATAILTPSLAMDCAIQQGFATDTCSGLDWSLQGLARGSDPVKGNISCYAVGSEE